MPAPDRVAAWYDITAKALVRNEFRIDRAADFQGSLRAAALGEAQVTDMVYSALRSDRTPRLIRQSDPGMYAVGLTLSGVQGLLQSRCEATVGRGDFVVYSTSRPFTALVDARGGPAGSVVVQLPRGAVGVPSDLVDRLLAVRIPGQEGTGRLLTTFLTQLATDTEACPPVQAQRLGRVLTELVSAWLAERVDALGELPVETRQQHLLLQVQDFIARDLGDAALTPTAVAAAHHISLRTLHRLFQQHADGATVASYIRGQRLSHARRDLVDPALSARPVQAIALRWGFPRPADFTRVFQAAYGVPPTEYRRLALPAHSGTRR
ncbi:AraC family transcriptional regulator [Streptomyces sp. NPDC057877]|uniref:AraC family transcriptional regulator n=1 Tax=Streptomyces sp. NPDC057877 TaxID=3346269 RepID=UPI00369C86B2